MKTLKLHNYFEVYISSLYILIITTYHHITTMDFCNMIITLLILLHITTAQVAHTLHVRTEHEQTLRVLFLSSTIYVHIISSTYYICFVYVYYPIVTMYIG